MNSSVGILIGGLLPAIAFGIGALFQKHSNDLGISQAYYLVAFSGGILIAATLAAFLFSNDLFSQPAVYSAIAHGLLFGIGFVCLAVGLTIYQQPVSKLVPLANMSTLVTVVLGILIFSEYKSLNTLYLITGAVLVVLGGILVSRA